MTAQPWLAAAGGLSAAASAAHLAIIVGGPRWYDFFGAGPRMVRLAEQGSPKAALITLGIAAVLAVWAAYAFSGAGMIPRLPFLKLALVAISAIYPSATSPACTPSGPRSGPSPGSVRPSFWSTPSST